MLAALALVATALGSCAGADGDDDADRSDPPVERGGTRTDDAFDAYGGATAVTLDATGRFRTEEIDGRWWLVTPDGHPFWSAGLNGVRPTGTADRHGNTPYADAVAAAHPDEQAWADAQLERFRQWGLNTLGGWSDDALGLFAGRAPYTVVLNLARSVDAQGRFSWTDLWDEAWAEDVQVRVAAAAEERADDPWLVGWFTDNEMPWGMGLGGDGLVTMLDLDLGRPATAPGKQELIRFLRARYSDDLARLAQDLPALSATSWDELGPPRDPLGLAATPGGKDTQVAWATAVAERYFSVVGPALDQADPDHLDLGVRFVAVATPQPVLEVAARSVDVVSVNFYEMTEDFDAAAIELSDGIPLVGTHDTLAGFGAAGKPVLIGEFSYRADDAGLPNTNPPIFTTVATQADRAAALGNYVRCLLATPYAVGAHWFLHADQPAAGRADGEDQNVGLVDVEDRPYPEVTAALAELHAEAYARLDGDGPDLPCTPVGTQARPG